MLDFCRDSAGVCRVISLFTGAGGMDLGFRLEGYNIVWANDFNKQACETYKNNLGSIVYKDVTTIDPYIDKAIPDCDLIIGGFPCQDFSNAWHEQPGIRGKRGLLFLDFKKFLDAKRPKAFVAENVVGLLSVDKGTTIARIIKEFENLGYIVKPHIYNFADYGVPQLRRRIVFVGVRLDTGFNFIHPAPTHGPKGKLPYMTAGQALEGVESVQANNEKANTQEITKARLALIPEGCSQKVIPDGHPLKTRCTYGHQYRRIHRDKPCFTLLAAGGGGAGVMFHYPEPRPLTNRERARLQTFPDDFIFYGSKTEVRRQLGNAVPPEGIRPVARTLKNLFTGNYKPIDLLPEFNKMQNMTTKQRLNYLNKELFKQQSTDI